MRYFAIALVTGTALTLGGAASATAHDDHAHSSGRGSIGSSGRYTPGYGFRGSHGRLHDDLEHRQFHRGLDHREAHRNPLTWRQHERLHDHLDHEAYHDRLEHRSYHRHVPQYGRFGFGRDHHRRGLSFFMFGR